jgi:nuclear mRNA export protein PCID2/THP1
MIPIVLSFSRALAFIASFLDRNPSILKHSQANPNIASTPINADALSGSDGKVGFLEDTANVLREAFVKCLSGSPGTPRTTPPDSSANSSDKRAGIYLTANATLKLLFQSRKIRNAQQMFLSIDAQSPPLSYYPAAQRVTYLYYLGRYHFANSHFIRASEALGAAYQQCHKGAKKHRSLILTHLIASNMCLGNVPSQKLLIRPEGMEAGKKFIPLIRTIKSGDIGEFDRLLSLSSTTSAWFLSRRILLQLRNRCEVLVWRSLIRKCFIISGYKGEDKKLPYLRLNFVQHAAQYSFSRARQGLAISTDYVDPDFRGIEAAQVETAFDIDTGTYTYNSSSQYEDHFPPESGLSPEQQSPTASEIESIFLSLIQQGFLSGFVSHSQQGARFAIPGSKADPVGKGFPNIYAVVSANNSEEGIVPGWVREESLGRGGMHLRAGSGGSGASMAGRVVNLSGARPVGMN